MTLPLAIEVSDPQEGKPFDDEEETVASDVPRTKSVGPHGAHSMSRRGKDTVYSQILDSSWFTLAMTVFTIYVLFADDLRITAFEKDADTAFMYVSFVALILFAAEMVMSIMVKPEYLKHNCNAETFNSDTWWRAFMFGSFYFWLDLVATLSLTLDIDFIIDSDGRERIFSAGAGDTNTARAGRASKAGARATRVVRIVRMVRLVRLVKLYKYYQDSRMHEQRRLEGGAEALRAQKRHSGAAVHRELEEEMGASESRVGQAMSEITTQRVIIIVLVMLIVIPVLTYDSSEDMTFLFASSMLKTFYESDPNDVDTLRGLTSDLLETAGSKVLQVAFWDADGTAIDGDLTQAVLGGAGSDRGIIRPAVFDSLRTDDDLQGEEIRAYGTYGTPGSDPALSVYGVHIVTDYSAEFTEESAFNMGLTCFIIVLLGLGTYVFSADVNRLVIYPIERMVRLVRTISENPLGFDYSKGAGGDKQEGMETTLLLQTITKIGGLMRVGFGEAGADIIAENLKSSTDHSLNLLSSGRKITSIFGFCDIRQFTDTTECLQEEVMLFVNRIAEVVHEIVVQCGGAANKNIGDAFLLTWKLDLDKPARVTELADRALLAFCKIAAEMARHQEFVCRFSVAATQRLLQRFPGYKVRMGNGLHIGWAIEGAIGTNRKIDASYISPHVNWSEYLESSTKIYGVPILMSEPFFERLSDEAKRWCRQLDTVRRGDNVKTGLFTHDCDVNADFLHNRKTAGDRDAADSFLRRLSNAPHVPQRPPRAAAVQRRKSQEPAARRARLSSTHYEVQVHGAAAINLGHYQRSVWDTDIDLLAMRTGINETFLKNWGAGFGAYIAGDWEAAARRLRLCLSLRRGDAPSTHLLKFMGEMAKSTAPLVAPDGWDGCRDDS